MTDSPTSNQQLPTPASEAPRDQPAGLTVVIPTRNEPRTWWTVANVLRGTRVPTEVLVVDDGSDARNFEEEATTGEVANELRTALGENPRPREVDWSLTVHRLKQPVGNCFARDAGIRRARFPSVLVLDAHCGFWGSGPGSEWSEAFARYGVERPRNLGCAVSVQLRESRGDTPAVLRCEDAPGRYWGAHLELSQVTSTGEHRILQGVWNRGLDLRRALGYTCEPGNGNGNRSRPDPAAPPVRVGCLMGGAYVLNRDRYVATGGVWANLRTWGTSEPVISVWNWLCGGESELLPVEVGHVYRTGQQDRVPWTHRDVDVLWNQAFLAALVSHGDPREFQEVLRPLTRHPGWRHCGGHLLEWLRAFESRVEDLWATKRALSDRTWAGYKRDWCDETVNY